MRKVWLQLKAIIDAVNASIEQEYKAIFKGAIVLIGVSLVGLSQAFPNLIEHDFRAKEIQFEIEAQEKKKISELECDTLQSNAAKCNLAKYQQNTNYFTTRVASYVVALSLYSGCFFMLISIFGFMLAAITKAKKNPREEQ